MAPDGSLTRTTRYLAQPSDEEELRTRYDLPAGGAWSSEKATSFSPVHQREMERITQRYEVTRRYSAGETIPPDYVRKAKVTGRPARNEVRLKARDRLFVKTFEYEERFRDIVTPEGFEDAAGRMFALWVGSLGEQLALESEGRIDAAAAAGAVKAEFDPQFTLFLNGIRDQGMKFIEGEVFKKEIDPLLDEEEEQLARVVSAVPAPPGVQPSAWRETIARAFKSTEDKVEAQMGEAFQEDLFGAHDPAGAYTFEVAVSLPGALLETNAEKRDGGRLVWEFVNEDFLFGERYLQARSRLFYPGRIALAAGVLLLACASAASTLRARGKGLAR